MLYIDEFQNFATSDDLATLITEARKYGIATTLAHQERYGQLGDNKKMMGATLAAHNKIYFRLTIKDAEELAGEFARNPTTETRPEEQYAISQSPVWDLMKGHNNPQIMEFVNNYLRPIRDRLNDIVGESELNRLMQQEYTQDASYFRISAKRWPTEDRTYSAINFRRNAMRYEEKAILAASQQTDKLKALNEEAANLQQMLRKINALFVQIMEGKINHGSDSFIQAIISIIKHINIPNGERNIYEFYFSVALFPELCSIFTIFAESRTIAIPYIIAKQEGKYLNEVAELEREVEEDHKKQMAKWEALSYEAASRLEWRSPERKPYTNLTPRYINFSDRITFTRRARSLITNDNIVSLLWKLIEVCRLLAEPENHIKVKTG